MNGAWRRRGVVGPRSTTGFPARQVGFFAAKIYIEESEDWITVAACAVAEFGQFGGEGGSIVAEIDCAEGLAHDSHASQIANPTLSAHLQKQVHVRLQCFGLLRCDERAR